MRERRSQRRWRWGCTRKAGGDGGAECEGGVAEGGDAGAECESGVAEGGDAGAECESGVAKGGGGGAECESGIAKGGHGGAARGRRHSPVARGAWCCDPWVYLKLGCDCR